jgi:hypothetical protein
VESRFSQVAIDTRNELDPTVEWLRDAIHRRLALRVDQVVEVYLADDKSPVTEDKPVEYHTLGQ